MTPDTSKESDSFLANQEIPHTFGYLIFINTFIRSHRRSQSDTNEIHSLPPFLSLKVYFNIILSSTTGPSNGCFLQFSPPVNICTSPLAYAGTWLVKFTILDFINRKIFSDIYRYLSSSICSFLHYIFIPSFLGPNILLSTLLTTNSAFIPSFNVSNKKQV